MKVAVFTLHLDPDTGAFDDGELRAFCETNQVLAVHQHLLTLDGIPAWAVLVTWRPRSRPGRAARPTGPTPGATEGRARTRSRETPVPEADRALYEALRAWRNQRAKRDGRPAFVLFKNNQLADLARERPTSAAAMQRIHGIGEAKARDYGPEVIALITAHERGDPGGGPAGATDTGVPDADSEPSAGTEPATGTATDPTTPTPEAPAHG